MEGIMVLVNGSSHINEVGGFFSCRAIHHLLSCSAGQKLLSSEAIDLRRSIFTHLVSALPNLLDSNGLFEATQVAKDKQTVITDVCSDLESLCLTVSRSPSASASSPSHPSVPDGSDSSLSSSLEPSELAEVQPTALMKSLTSEECVQLCQNLLSTIAKLGGHRVEIAIAASRLLFAALKAQHGTLLKQMYDMNAVGILLDCMKSYSEGCPSELARVVTPVLSPLLKLKQVLQK